MDAANPLYEELLQVLPRLYPEVKLDWRGAVSPLIVCPTDVKLARALKSQAEKIVAAFFALRGLPTRAMELSAQPPSVAVPGNSSVLMSYDFHVDSTGHLRLIEINTNASMSLMVDAMMEAKKTPREFSSEFRREIVDTFEHEHELARPGHKIRCAVIVDEHPEAQKLFVEFKMYEDLFRRRGWIVSIEDTSKLRIEGDRLVGSHGPIDLVYNRDTDFYLEHSRVAALREATERNLACVTPHPHEYRLLADKERLFELAKPGAIEALPLALEHKQALNATLLHSMVIDSTTDKEKLWSERKKWFFKPRRSFGAKAAYRGSSISRGAFDSILSGTHMAQEFVPAPLIGDFKYDLRFYAYRDRVQLACARLYQGQLTNTQTPGGGIAPIYWV